MGSSTVIGTTRTSAMANKTNKVVASGKPAGRPNKGKSVPYVPNGNPRGRKLGYTKRLDNRGAHFRVPDHLKVEKKIPVYVPTGNPMGRPNLGKTEQNKYVPNGKPRGRPAKAT